MPSLVSLAGKGLIGLLSTVAASLTALGKSVANFPKTLRWHHWGMLLLPFAFFLLALQYAKEVSYNDPTSPYFSPARGYAKIYSSVRQREATEFIQKHNSTDAAPFRRKSTHVPPFICVGMNTIVRPSGDIYARYALGSMLAGLTQKERNQLYIAPMIGHVNATTHPIYTEPWLEKVSDKVMTYQTMDVVSEERLKHIEELELTRQRTGEPDREKHLGDYTLLLKQCDATGAPYVLMLEDDILFLDGWFHRLRQGIMDVEEQSKRDEGGWYNLRLFYLEYGFYWHLSEVITTGVAIVAFCGVSMGLIWLSIRGTRWYRRTTRQTRRVLFLTGVLSAIACIVLYLTVGHLTVAHMLRTPSVARRGGCCFQGILWPHDKVEPITEFYTKERIGFVDSLADKFINGGGADKPMGHQWALVPTAVQHIGGKSSKGDNWGSDKPGKMSEAQRLWNFSFEWNKADKLAEEHRQAAEAFEQEKVTGDD